MKSLTRKQIESRKAQAVRFAREVREDDGLADEIEDESALEQYRLAHQLAPDNKSYKEACKRIERQLKHR